MLQFLAQKLPVSRLQRDLTDSTVLRNIGVPMGHALIAFQSTLKGLHKLILHEETLANDLENTWAVVAEADSNHFAKRGLSQSLRGTEGADTHQREDDRTYYSQLCKHT